MEAHSGAAASLKRFSTVRRETVLALHPAITARCSLPTRFTILAPDGIFGISLSSAHPFSEIRRPPSRREKRSAIGQSSPIFLILACIPMT